MMLLAIVIYRVAYYAPESGIDKAKLAANFQSARGHAARQAADLFAMFTAGDLGGAKR